MAFTLRVHEYQVNPQTAERELVEYRPLLRLGCSSPDGYSGEIVYLQGGCVYGEGGAAYTPADLPDWFGAALAAVSPHALADVGFPPDVVQVYVRGAGEGAGSEGGRNEGVPGSPESPLTPFLPHSLLPPPCPLPPGFKPDQWVLGWLCKHSHDYQHTGQSRYNKRMQCVDCEALRKKGTKARPPVREASGG